MTDKSRSYRGPKNGTGPAGNDPPQEGRRPARGQRRAQERPDVYSASALDEHELDGDDGLEDPAFAEPEGLGEDMLDQEEEFYPERTLRRPRPALADVAARAALHWGQRAETRALEQDDGGSRRVSGSRDRPARVCSAAMQEGYELLDALAAAAATTEDATEAAGLAASMVPVVAGLIPEASRALWSAMPALVRGVMGVTSVLHRRPSTRAQIGRLPEIMCATAEQLAEFALQGRPMSGRLAAEVLAEETRAALSRLNRSRHGRGT